jgi:hypothetical protein
MFDPFRTFGTLAIGHASDRGGQEAPSSSSASCLLIEVVDNASSDYIY